MTTVSVACKLPSGLIIEMGEKSVTLLGSAHASSVGGYGITRNVDEAAFDKWMADNADFSPVKAGLIFKAATADRAADQAREMASVTNGMEGLNASRPDLDPRLDIAKADKIEPTDETKKELASQDPEAAGGKRANRGRGDR